jgi:hypothetical protein
MTRPVERIGIFIDLVDWTKLLKPLNRSDEETTEVVKIIKDNIAIIYDFWIENPDLRVFQVLINLGVIANSWTYGSIYYEEDWVLLDKQGINPRDFLLWGTLGKDKKEFKRILIKNMEFSHIKAIMNDFTKGKLKVHSFYLTAFENELKKDFKVIC